MVRLGLFLLSAVLLLTGSTLLYATESVPLSTATASPSHSAPVRPESSEVAHSPTPTPTRSHRPSERPTEALPSVPPPSLVEQTLEPSPTLLPLPTVAPTPCIEVPGVTICLQLP